MTCLVDEIVQVDKGIYLGQLVFATRILRWQRRFTFYTDPTGEPYAPNHDGPDYDIRTMVFSDDGSGLCKTNLCRVPQLRPVRRERLRELGYDQPAAQRSQLPTAQIAGRRYDIEKKIHRLMTTSSPKAGDVTYMNCCTKMSPCADDKTHQLRHIGTDKSG